MTTGQIIRQILEEHGAEDVWSEGELGLIVAELVALHPKPDPFLGADSRG